MALAQDALRCIYQMPQLDASKSDTLLQLLGER
jgi:hypothetical protein